MTSNVFALRRVNALDLRRMAVEAHPGNRSHQLKYLRSVRYLRRRRLWIRDGHRPGWGVPGDAA